MNKKKLLQRIYNNYRNVRFDDFVAIVEAYGFVLTRSEGSHRIYKNSAVSEFLNLQNINGEAKPYQIKLFLSIVEKYNLEMGD
jgi:hypothetical protein